MKVVVVGGGPAGITAAVRARRLGAEVMLLERELLGGVCYNEGPVPVRTLARAARMARDAGAWAAFGLVGSPPSVDVGVALAHARRAARYIHDVKQIGEKLRAEGIEVTEGAGGVRFVDAHTLAVPDGRLIECDRIILAVGGHDRRLEIPGGELALSFRAVENLTALPRRIVVIGGASTGCQLASIFADFGGHVTVIEAARSLIPQEDIDLGTSLELAFGARGIGVYTGAYTQRLQHSDEGIDVFFTQGDRETHVQGDAVFSAVGWLGNLEGLGLDAAGIASEGGYVRVDETLRTNLPHIYAVGDVNGIRMLMQTAAHQGRIAAENAVLDQRRIYESHVVPSGSFTDPEYGSVGLTEAQADARGGHVTARHSYRLLSRAVIDGRTEGFCKLIAERSTGMLVGAHVLGEYSAEVVQVAAVCIAAHMTVMQVAELQLAYPTFTQAVSLAALRLARMIGMLPSADVFDQTAELDGLSAGEATLEQVS